MVGTEKSDNMKCLGLSIVQGSALGPILFNVLLMAWHLLSKINVLYTIIQMITLSISCIMSLMIWGWIVNTILKWLLNFQENHIKVNASNFLWFILKPKGVISDVEFEVPGHSLKPVCSVKLLREREKIGESLYFDVHIPSLCQGVSSNQCLTPYR